MKFITDKFEELLLFLVVQEVTEIQYCILITILSYN